MKLNRTRRALMAHAKRSDLLKEAMNMPSLVHNVDKKKGLLTEEEWARSEVLKWIAGNLKLLAWMRWVMAYCGLIWHDKESGSWVGCKDWEEKYEKASKEKSVSANQGRPKAKNTESFVSVVMKALPMSYFELMNIGKGCKISKSTILRVVRDLTAKNLIFKSPIDKKWYLVPKVSEVPEVSEPAI